MREPTPTPKHKVVSVFSGAMGLDVGLEQTHAFETIACVEQDQSCCDTIRANRDAGRLTPALKIFQGDVTDFDPTHILKQCGLHPGEVDVLVGGPPCQSFSTAGKRRTTQDPRGTLLWQFLRYVQHMCPKFFLMENVRGLVSAALKTRPPSQRPERGGPPLKPEEQPGSVMKMLFRDFNNLAPRYRVDAFVVNAVNYGAPQIRERVLLFGNRFDAVVDFPEQTHADPTQPPQLNLFCEPMLPWRTLGDAIQHLDDPGDIILDFSPRKKRYLDHIPPGQNWRSMPPELQQESMGKAHTSQGGRSGWWRRLSHDLPCPTLLTMPNHSSTSLCHPDHTRALSLKEYAAVQEFPPDWTFCGTPTSQYAQVGNAVPVRLGEIAGQVLDDELTKLKARKLSPYMDSPLPWRVIQIQPHVRTHRWSQ